MSHRSLSFIPFYRSSLKHELKIAAGLLFLLLIFRFQAILQLGEAFIGGYERDSGLYIWLIQSNTRDLFDLPWFNTKAFYPYTRTLAWSDNFIVPSLVLAPFLKMGVSLVVGYNLLILFSQFLNGYLTYRLCFVLSGALIPSFIGGAAFMLTSYLTSVLGHPQLQFAFWIPLTLHALFFFCRSPKLLTALPIGTLIFFSFLTTVYYSIFCCVLLITALAGVALLQPKRIKLREYASLALGILIGVIPLIPFILPYLETRDVFGARELYEPYYFSATILSFLSAPPFSVLYPHLAQLTHGEAHLFPGTLILVGAFFACLRITQAKKLRSLAIEFSILFAATALFSALESPNDKLLCAIFLWLSLIWAGRLIFCLGALERKLKFQIITDRGLLAIFALCAFIFFALSLGPLGNPEKGELALGIFRLPYETFPGFNSIRAISRIGVVTIFCLIVLATLELARYAKKSGVKPWSVLALLVIVALENLHYKFPLEKPTPDSTIYGKLAAHVPANSAVIALPLAAELNTAGGVKSWGEYARLNVNYMNWLFPSGLYYMNGYSGQRSKIMKEFPKLLANFPDDRSFRALGHVAGVTHVIFNSKFVPNFDKENFLKRVNQYSSRVKLLENDSNETFLLKLTPELRLDEDNYLLVPSYPSGILTIEIEVLYVKDEPEFEIEIFSDLLPNIPLGRALLKANGKAQTLSFSLPGGDERMRLTKLAFRVPPDREVFLKSSSYAPR